jgi:arsenical pump membrane protein
VPAPLAHSLSQTWPPFVLIAGLLLVGTAAAADHLFEVAGGWLGRLPGGGAWLFSSLMALVASVTVVLNLDTSVVFLTPIVLHAARSRGLDETAFLYGVVAMSNSASLLLPGSNLTNLLVLHGRGDTGAAFAAGMAPAWGAAVVVTLVVLLAWRHRDLLGAKTARSPSAGGATAASGGAGAASGGAGAPGREPALHIGPGVVATAGAAVLVLVLRNPAPWVLVVGAAAVALQVASGRLTWRPALRALGPVTLSGIFVLAVALGWLARAWGGPARLLAHLGTVATSLLAVGASVVVNNLPAAVLLSARQPTHARALLFGLDLGPNLAVTGSLSALLWLRVARTSRARPSARTYSALGALLVPCTVFAAVGATAVLAPHSL